MNIQRITSRQNPLLVHIKKLLSSRSYRNSNGQFAADGVKLLKEAVLWNASLDTVIMTEGAVDFPLPGTIRQVIVPQDVMQSISLMEAPQGAIFVCNYPEVKPLHISSRSLILDGIQDPGNVGTILRTADALGTPVVLSSGCADVYNPKTVRATMGAVFRTVPQTASREDILSYCLKHELPIYATALSDSAEDLRGSTLDGPVVIGSEGRGVSEAFLSASKKQIVIPMEAGCESLNAAIAAAIIMWEQARNR